MIASRRQTLGTLGVGASALSLAPRAMAAPSTPPLAKPRLFTVTTEVDLGQRPGQAQVWLPLFAASTQYQKVIDTNWQGAAKVLPIGDKRNGARVLHARFDAEASTRRLTLSQTLAVWDRAPTPAKRLSAAERAYWTAAAPGIPTDGIVGETARKIVGNLSDPAARLRAIYDWMVANTWRDGTVVGCGDGDIDRMLKSGKLSGKCADLNGLVVGLARASGIPAREVYGLRLAKSQLYPSLGRAGTVSGAQHCRAEAWLDGIGWFAIDPADVRKAVLEDKLDPAGQPVRDLAQRLYGKWEDNWAAYNQGTGLILPGAQGKQPYRFLMYPTAVCADEAVVCTDAARFRYAITSTEQLA